MAQRNPDDAKHAGRKGLSVSLLVAFTGICVVLIIMIWGENIAGEDAGRPSFYRDTFVIDDAYRATATAEALRTSP